MYYAIMGVDHEESLEARRNARPDHIQRLKQLMDEGRLLLAGPHPAIDNEDPGAAGFTGSLIVAEFSDLEQAKTWASSDPYVLAGVYSSVTVKPFNKALP
ncbi:MAG: YciI family protein [Gammaproteobacteria bacterium]|nr:YciI family protein [Gammaproteobacteria bacterium]